MSRKKKVVQDVAHANGMFRINVLENGKVVGDSGWCKNQITDLGAQYYLVENLVAGGNSKRVTHMAIGSGTAPAVAATTLPAEIGGSSNRIAVSTSVVASRTMQATASFGSAQFGSLCPLTISSLGLYGNASSNSIFAGNTFNSSQWNSNQDVSATYQVKFP